MLSEESRGEISCEDEDDDGVSPPTRLHCITLNTQQIGPVGVLAIRICLPPEDLNHIVLLGNLSYRFSREHGLFLQRECT